MTEALLVLEVVMCIKAVINSRAGLEFLINSYDDAASLIKSNYSISHSTKASSISCCGALA